MFLYLANELNYQWKKKYFICIFRLKLEVEANKDYKFFER